MGILRAIEPGPTSMDGDDSNMSSSDSDAIYYHGLFDVENPDRTLRIGMTAQISIVLAKADNALLVPSQVLRIKPNAQAFNKSNAGSGPQYQVPVLVDNRVQYVDVMVGINNKINAEIITGLNEGDLVVIGMPSTGSSQTRRPPSARF